MLQAPEREKLEKAVAFNFKSSNNKAEYEALVIGMQLAKVCGASTLKTYCDLQLVVGQVQGEFEVRR